MGEPVRVSVVALDPMLEAGATGALHSCPDLAVAGPGEPPEVTVVIVDAVADSVLDLVRETRDGPDRPEVVLVATDLAPAEALHAIAAGARGLLRRREASADRLARTVLAAAGGDCTVPPDLLDELLEHRARPVPRAGIGGVALNEREREVLRLVADGRETGEIAQQLCYSPRTVVSVVHDITHRFRLRNRAHAVAYALRAGLL
ncbi:response regulator transcription factor [Crossiella sp. SN42]|uniref:response regulator transcription factor n=1 Tax=Crossiella sp. SN42 TaxID=2944808 RepID=UPI00207CD936|nr:response regulator transcription factor [Crossiella sp. SN42]MCO1578426.1 response regulator transcription factor [Crossiella sp. SN42]